MEKEINYFKLLLTVFWKLCHNTFPHWRCLHSAIFGRFRDISAIFVSGICWPISVLMLLFFCMKVTKKNIATYKLPQNLLFYASFEVFYATSGETRISWFYTTYE